MYEFSEIGWLKHVIFHPVEGFEDLRWKKRGSLKFSVVIIFMLFFSMLAEYRLQGFQYNTHYTKIFNVVPLILRSVIFYITWCVGNWSICTLFDGEGTFKNICIYTSYALVPFIVFSFVSTFLSNILILDEAVWIEFFNWLGFGWSLILMVQAMRAVHQYSFGKTLVSMLATVGAMFILLFLLVLVLLLFQQVYNFIYTVYMEIQYRIMG